MTFSPLIFFLFFLLTVVLYDDGEYTVIFL